MKNFTIIKAIKKPLRLLWQHYYQIYMDVKSFFSKGWIVYESSKLNLTLLLNLNSYIDFCIYAHGHYDIESLEQIARCIQKLKLLNEQSNWFLDIGSNIGLMSLFLQKKYPDLIIDAFEPLEQNFYQNKINQQINNLSFNLHQVALSNKSADIAEIFLNDSPIKFEYSKYNMGMASLCKNQYRTGKRVEQCQIISFDLFLQKQKPANYEKNKNILIKIDVEGTEMDVLKGMINFIDSIKSQIVLIFIELLFEENLEECIHTVNFLKTKNFIFFNMSFQKIPTHEFTKLRSGNFIFSRNFN